MKINLISKILALFFCCSLYAFQCHMGGPERLFAPNYNQSNRAHKNLASDMPNEPGKCFAKCLIPDLYEEIVIDSMAMYTGQDSSNIMFAERML